MNDISLKAYAKINLSLDVLGKLPNGYHEVKMIMQQVELWDVVTVACRELSEGQTTEILGASTREDLPMDETNIAYKAARLMKDTYRPKSEYAITITLDKRIPMAAGLAGGSADAAAVMRALARLWSLDVTCGELAAISAQLGSDVPFCLMGQEGQFCALAEGTGTKLTPVRPLCAWIVLSKAPVGVSTKEVYQSLKLEGLAHPDVNRMVRGLNECNWPMVYQSMGNVLEAPAISLCPVVGETKTAMTSLGLANAVLMSGSGPTVFGVFMNRSKAQSAYRAMKQMHDETFLVRTLR